MAELGNINPLKKMACPNCRAVLPEWSVDEILGKEPLRCPSCGSRVKVPDDVLDRARRSRYVGGNLDFTC
ncbi:MAG: hypothetical protein HY319_16945 [Armatimonadetes bacterium]|nr:hypothetical protein [Armatimonadota bacterium]